MDEDNKIRCQDCMSLLNIWGTCTDCENKLASLEKEIKPKMQTMPDNELHDTIDRVLVIALGFQSLLSDLFKERDRRK